MDAVEAHRLLEQVDHDFLLLDWTQFWDEDDREADWLAEPLLPARRSVALFADGGVGKSLLALWLAAGLATGRDLFGVSHPLAHVLYLDYEMTRADLRERLEDMGYGAGDDLKHLHYALLPDLGPLDSRAGGDAVVALAERVEADLVVVDTFGRAVAGKENDADTVRDWYRWTGVRLKNAGRGFVRIDHSGKVHELGQRGSSAKNDDVDIVWHLTRLDEGRFRLKTRKRRLPWVPETVELELLETDNVIGYRVLVGALTYPNGTAAVADDLDRVAVPLDWGRPKAAKALRDAGLKARNTVLSAAIKYRRERVENLSPWPKSDDRMIPARTDDGSSVKPQVGMSGTVGDSHSVSEGKEEGVSCKGHPLSPDRSSPSVEPGTEEPDAF